MADTLKDYLIGVEWKMNEGDANKLQALVTKLDSSIRALGQQLDGMTAKTGGAGKALGNQADGANKAAAATEKLGTAARSAGSSVQNAGNAARNAGSAANQMAAGMKKSFDMLKKIIGIGSAVAAFNKFKSLFTSAVKLNEELEQSAKKLNKTVEDTRAYNIALEAMGKTAQEIQQSKDLQQTFKQLQAIGKQLALPEAARGLKGIQNIKNSVMGLKVTFTYSMQWIVYKLQEVAKGPLKEVRDLIDKFRGFLGDNMPQIATTVATHLGRIMQLGSSVIQFVTMILEGIDKLPTSVKLAGAAALGVLALIKGKIRPVHLIVSAIVLLIDDFITYMQGGDALFGDFWGWCITWGQKAWDKINEIYNLITTTWNEADGFLDFIKRLTLGKDYTPDASWADVGAKIWDMIKSGFGKVSELLKKLILGSDYTPSSTWRHAGVKIWNKIKSGFGKVSELLKKLILGKDYTPSSTWRHAGVKIWNKIKSAIGTGTELLKKLILGDDYQEGDSWGKAGSKIWDKIKEKIKSGSELLKELVLGDDYQEGDSWLKAGQAIWDKIKSEIKSGSELLKEFILGNDYEPGDSWLKAGAAIWLKIKSFFQSGAELIKGIILGNDYTADSSWADAGKKIWDKIKSGITATGDWLKKLIGFEPGFGWKKIGQDIWDKIKSGISAAGDWLKSKIKFTPNDKWANIGKRVWRSIKNGISATGDWLKKKIGFTPGDSWATIGKDIWDKIRGGIAAAKNWLFDKLFPNGAGENGENVGGNWETIGSGIWTAIKNGFKLVGNWVFGLLFPDGVPTDIGGDWATVAVKIGQAITNHFTKANLIDVATGLIKGITESLTDVDPETGGLSSTIQTLFDGLLEGIVNGLGAASIAAADLINALGDLFTALFTPENIKAAFELVGNLGSSLVGTLSTVIVNALNAASTIDFVGILGTAGTGIVGIATGLLDAITKALGKLNAKSIGNAAGNLVKNLFGALKNVFTADNIKNLGTSVLDFGKTIVSAIGDLFAGAEDSGMATDLADTCSTLIQNLVSGLAGLVTSDSLRDFAVSLGTALSSLGSVVGEFAGSFLGDLLNYIFSEQALNDFLGLLSGVGEFIVNAILAGMRAAGSLLESFVDSLLIKLGIIDEETRDKALEIGKELVSDMETGAAEGASEEDRQGSIIQAAVAEEAGYGVNATGKASLYGDEYAKEVAIAQSTINLASNLAESAEEFAHMVQYGLSDELQEFAELNGYDFQPFGTSRGDDFWKGVYDVINSTDRNYQNAKLEELFNLSGSTLEADTVTVNADKLQDETGGSSGSGGHRPGFFQSFANMAFGNLSDAYHSANYILNGVGRASSMTAAGVTNNNSTRNNYTTINAPATINVSGTDAKSTADQVNEDHAGHIMRNLRGLLVGS